MAGQRFGTGGEYYTIKTVHLSSLSGVEKFAIFDVQYHKHPLGIVGIRELEISVVYLER